MGLYTPSNYDAELNKISQAFSSPDDYRQLNPLNKLPAKYKDGTLIFVTAALSTSLGLAGVGFYGYHSGAWNKLG